MLRCDAFFDVNIVGRSGLIADRQVRPFNTGNLVSFFQIKLAQTNLPLSDDVASLGLGRSGKPFSQHLHKVQRGQEGIGLDMG